MKHLPTILFIIGITMTLSAIVHTEWHKYKLERFKKGMMPLADAENDPQAKALIQRRHEEGSKWKLWKTMCTIGGIVLGAAAFLGNKYL